MSEQALTKMPKREVAQTQTPQSIEVSFMDKLIEKAVDSKQAVEVLEKLRAMRREDQERAAEAAFDAAMSRFQSECPVIVKSVGVRTNSNQLAYKYAPIEKIEEVIRPIEQANGFSHTFDQDVSSKENWVITKCSVTHVDPVAGSFTKVKTSMFPLGTKTQIMSQTQVYAAALSFANRRTLANAYGLVIAGEDKDGGGNDRSKPKVDASKPIAKMEEKSAEEHRALCVELWTLLGADRRGKAQNWDAANQWLWKEEILDSGNVDDRMPDIKIDRLKTVIAKVKEQLK